MANILSGAVGSGSSAGAPVSPPPVGKKQAIGAAIKSRLSKKKGPVTPILSDVQTVDINARANARRRARSSSGLQSTILTGGYSPTGQASPVTGG